MGNANAFLQTFAGGEFGDAMSARVGIEAYQASCEIMENWFCMAQGPMFRRPPLEYIDSFTNSSLLGIIKAFQFDVGQNYLLLITGNGIEFFLQDGKIEIPLITATISNGTFSSFTGWTDSSGTGSASGADGALFLSSNGATSAAARTSFTINQSNTLHVIVFDVLNGPPVNLRIGSSAGGAQFLDEMELRVGHHRLSFTPTSGTCHIEFWIKSENVTHVDNVSLLPGPTFILPTPWAEEDMRAVYTAQDGDRMFMFHRNYEPRVLERRAHRSWSLILFRPDDGPFDDGDNTIRMTPAIRYKTGTVTASRAYFTPDDVGRLLRLTHSGQYVKVVAASDAVYGESVRVGGIGGDRSFQVAITGTWAGTLTLERSVGNQNQFTKVLTYTGNTSVTYNDSYPDAADETTGTHNDALYTASNNTEGTFNNLTTFYRFAVYPGNYTSGTITAEISYDGGGSTVGVARIAGYNNATSVEVGVIKPFSRAGATDIWDIGTWCPANEFPNCVAFASGRFWAARRRRLWASVSDDYFSFQDGTNADQSIDITLRSKSSEGVRWMRHLDFLCVGTRNEEYVIRSSNTAEGISATTIDPGLMSEEGGAGIEAAVGGDSIIFVHRSGRRIFQFAHNPRALTDSAFIAVDLNRLNPESVEDGIVNIAIQQEPERRIFVVLRSGIVKTALFRREEEIVAWATMRTEGGFIEDVCCFPEDDIDAVYFIVRRNIGGNYVRMIERMSSELVVNDEDLVHLDSYLQTEIERPSAILTFTATTAGDSVDIAASQSVFNSGHVGKILWADGGRIQITTYTDVFHVSGTILNDLTGEQDPDDENAIIPRPVPPGKWGIATPVSSVTGLNHLEGEMVQVWGDKTYMGTATVSGGAVTLPSAASRVFVGKRMISRWKGLKLAYGAAKGTAVLQSKNVNQMGFVLRRTADGLKFGQDFKRMKSLVLQTSSPFMEAGPPLFTGERHEAFNGKFDTDPRLTIRADTPGPATIVALIPNVQTNER